MPLRNRRNREVSMFKHPYGEKKPTSFLSRKLFLPRSFNVHPSEKPCSSFGSKQQSLLKSFVKTKLAVWTSEKMDVKYNWEFSKSLNASKLKKIQT